MQTARYNRAVREACDWCHTRKIRCIPTEGTDCKACAQSQRPCKFSRPERMGRPKSTRRTSQGKSVDANDISWAFKHPWQGNSSGDWLFGADSVPENFAIDPFPLHWTQSTSSEILNQPLPGASSSVTPLAALPNNGMGLHQSELGNCAALRMIDRAHDGSEKSTEARKESGPQHVDFATLSAIHLDIDRLCPQNLSSARLIAESDSCEELLDRVSALCAIVRSILSAVKTHGDERSSLPCLDKPFPFLVFSTILKVITSYQTIVDACACDSPHTNESLSTSSSSEMRSPHSPGQISPVNDHEKRSWDQTPSTLMQLLSVDLQKLHSFNMIDYHLLHFLHLVLLFEVEPSRQEPNILESVRGSRDRILELHRRLRYFLSSACMTWDLSDA